MLRTGRSLADFATTRASGVPLKVAPVCPGLKLTYPKKNNLPGRQVHCRAAQLRQRQNPATQNKPTSCEADYSHSQQSSVIPQKIRLLRSYINSRHAVSSSVPGPRSLTPGPFFIANYKKSRLCRHPSITQPGTFISLF